MNEDNKITVREIVGAVINLGIFFIVLYAMMWIATL